MERGDFSRFTRDSSKDYIATFMQQGRVQLDADWNDNVLSFLNMLWKQSRTVLGTSACIGDSFRIGKDTPIDHMLQPDLWNPVDMSGNKHAYIFLNTNDRPCTDLHSANEKGSLFVENAGGILREFNNLDLSRSKSLYLRFKIIRRSGKDVRALKLKLYSQRRENGNNEDKYEYAGEFIEPADAGGFLQVRFNLLQPQGIAKNLDKYDVSHVSKLSVHWDKIDDIAVCIGLISVEPMALVVSADPDTSKSNPWANVRDAGATTGATTDNTPPAQNNNSISNTYKGKPAIRKDKGKDIRWSFSKPENFNSLNALRFAIGSSIGKDKVAYSNPPTLFLINLNDMTLEYSLKEQNELSNDQWRSYIVSVKEPKDSEKFSADNLKEIKTIGLKDLPENDSVYVSEILGELNFENNFLISSATEPDQSAGMYINGIFCSIEHWDTYLTQKHISSDNSDRLLVSASPPPPPSSSSSSTTTATSAGKSGENQKEQKNRNNTISYMVYTDVWNRGITHLEDPEIREVALGGPDTATKLQTICQIKLKELKEITDQVNFQNKIRIAEQEIKKMNEEQTGRLNVFESGSSSSSSSSSSEINYGTRGNYLYRIQIHDSGENKSNNSATFKWSKDNASVAFAIKQLSEYKVVLEQGGRSLANLFRIGDFIEIIDDIDELSEQPRGQIRRITHIDVKDTKTLYWDSKVSSKQLAPSYLHDPIRTGGGRYRPESHPKVILWDGIKYVNAKEKEKGEEEEVEEPSSDGSISLGGLSDGDGHMRIKFDPGLFRSGDYWIFTTRSNGGVELLRSAKPMGPKHNYALLALIRKEIGKEIEIIEDLRHTFQPLTNLRAIDISYENGGQMHSSPKNVQAAIQRLSEERTHILSGKNNTINGSIKELLIEAGEINELKPARAKEGTFAAKVSFNDVYQHKPFLIYSIRSGKRWDVRHSIHMLASDDEGHISKDPLDDGTKNYAWKGFQIESDENAQISWLAVGDSYTYFERFVKRILDEIFYVIFGVNSDQLKDDSSILDAWYKKYLRNLSDSGPDLTVEARKHWERLQKDFDKWVRDVDKQVEDFQGELEEVFDFNDEEKKKEEEQKAARELPKPSAQTVKCPSCGRTYPKGKYAFCTNCRTKLPVE